MSMYGTFPYVRDLVRQQLKGVLFQKLHISTGDCTLARGGLMEGRVASEGIGVTVSGRVGMRSDRLWWW